MTCGTVRSNLTAATAVAKTLSSTNPVSRTTDQSSRTLPERRTLAASHSPSATATTSESNSGAVLVSVATRGTLATCPSRTANRKITTKTSAPVITWIAATGSPVCISRLSVVSDTLHRAACGRYPRLFTALPACRLAEARLWASCRSRGLPSLLQEKNQQQSEDPAQQYTDGPIHYGPR